MGNTKRVFIAIEVPESIRQSLAPALSQIRDVQWHPGKNFHITIKFIGDTSIESIPQLESLLDFVGSTFKPFVVNFKVLKVVESRLRLIVGNPEILAHMRETFEHNLEKIGLFHQDQIMFEPHITLGKVQRDFQVPQVDFDFSKISFNVNEIGLYETIRGQTAAEFVLLKESKLK